MATVSTGYDIMDRAGLQAWLREAAELTPRQREMLDLYIYHNMSVTDIADALGVNKSTVSRSLRRSFQRLERCLKYSL